MSGPLSQPPPARASASEPGGSVAGQPNRARLTPLVLVESATLLSGTGNGIAAVALPWLILERTGSAVAAGAVAAAAALPLLLSALFSGTLVDLLGRRRTAVGADLASAAAVAAIPLVDATGHLTVPVLMVLAGLGAVFDPAGLAARETMLPAAAHAAGWRLDRANGLHEAVWGVAYLVGPGLGGLLIATLGATSALAATAVGFVCAALLASLIRVTQPAVAEHERPRGLVRGTVEGLRFVWSDRLLRALAILSTLVVGLYLPVEAVVLPVHFQALDTPGRLGLLLAVMSAGGIAGSLAYGALAPRLRRRTSFVAALVGTAIPLVAMATLPPYPVMLVLAAVIGLAYGPINPVINFAMQTRTPEHLRGRVFGVLTSVGYAAGPAGYLVAGPLVAGAGVQAAFLSLSLAFLAVSIGALVTPSLRHLDAPPRYTPSAADGSAIEHGVEHGPLPLGEQSMPH